MPTYTMVARSKASAVFYPENALEMICTVAGGREIRAVFRTNYSQGYEVPLPTFFYVEATGEAANIPEASRVFHQAALEVATTMAFVANADLGNLEVELVFDSSPDRTEHEFLQTFLPGYQVLQVPGRPIDPILARDFMAILSAHPERLRLQAAIIQYNEALKRWNAGHGLICLAHLYMGVEALTKTSLRAQMAATGKSKDDLVREWGIDLKQLDNEARRRLIFDGDVASFKIAKDVSDGFEHGYGDFSKMHQPAGEVVVKVASYLRRSIIRLSGVDAKQSEAMMAEPYAQPLGPINLKKQVHGTLVGNVENLAMKDRPYPILNWRTGIKRVTFGEDGLYSFDPEENITPELGEGTVLQLGAFEVWSKQLTDPKAAELANQRVPRQPLIARHTKAASTTFWKKVFRILTSLVPRAGRPG